MLATFGSREPSAPPDADAALIARHRDGDPDAFAAIYRTHVAAVYRRLTRILGPIAEREDLAQDVFLALHRALPRFRGEARLGTLIHRIAINRAYEHLRRQGRRPATIVDGWFFDELTGGSPTPETRVAAREDLEHVLACLARIKPKKRIAFLLRVVDGLSFHEIGELVDASAETVAKRVQHGQRELDALLARHEGAA
ncbi:MAG TPA: RNA polymerase sigma factor [Kofleriaceae bacterium]|nr:RNA polymerase sigma factor [Kofleriaceae bacterium]